MANERRGAMTFAEASCMCVRLTSNLGPAVPSGRPQADNRIQSRVVQLASATLQMRLYSVDDRRDEAGDTGFRIQSSLAPFQGAGHFGSRVRGYRCRPPPTTPRAGCPGGARPGYDLASLRDGGGDGNTERSIRAGENRPRKHQGASPIARPLPITGRLTPPARHYISKF